MKREQEALAIRAELAQLEHRGRGHICACGCGKAIRVLAQHRAKGIPRYLRAHHPMAMTRETHRLRNEGLLTATAVAEELGIGAITLRRIEGKLFDPVPRRRKRRNRSSTATRWSRSEGPCGVRPASEPELLSFRRWPVAQGVRRARSGAARAPSCRPAKGWASRKERRRIFMNPQYQEFSFWEEAAALRM